MLVKMATLCLQEEEIRISRSPWYKSERLINMRYSTKALGENLDFIETSNFISESTEVAARGCSGINSQVNTCGGVLL